MTYTPLNQYEESLQTDSRYHYQFIFNVFGHFFKDLKEYFVDYLYPRFRWSVVGTYDKAVEYITKSEDFGRESDKPLLPALILNPSGDFRLDDSGKQLWRFPNLAPGMIKNIFEPIYQDQNLLITAAFGRFTGEVELIILLPSFYEFCDLKVFLIQMFGGTDRYFYPVFFNSFIIIEDDLYNYEYYNPVTGLRYTIDWEGAGASDRLVPATNRTEHIFPCNIKPLIKMTGLSDSSSRYGGSDNIAEWKLSVTLEYQVELPTFIILESDYLVDHLDFNIHYESCYSANDFKPPETRIIREYSWETGLDETSNSEYDPDTTAAQGEERLITYKNRYYHIVTEDDVDSTSDLNIEIPSPVIDDLNLILVNGKYGLMTTDYFYLAEDGKSIYIDREYVTIAAGDVYEIYIYDYT